MEINFKASNKQGQALRFLYDDHTTQIGYGGGAGGGKSFIGVFRVRSMCVKHPGVRMFFGRKELTNLRKTTLNSYYKFLADYGIPGTDKGILNNRDNTIKFANGSEIMLLDLAYQPSDPLYTRFGSLELTGGFVDESNETEYKCLDILNTRIGRHKNMDYKIKPKILETFNPDKGHIYDRYYKPWKSGTLPEWRAFIPALVTDNPYVDPNYIEQLKKADIVTQQRLLHGNFEYDDTEGKLFRYDEILDLFAGEIEISNIKFLSCDIARLGDDKTVISYREGLDCKGIYIHSGLTTDLTVNEIKKLEYEKGVPRSNIVIDSDGVGGGVADQLRGCINFINNGRPLDTRQQTNFSNLKTQCYYMLRELAEKRKIKIRTDGHIKDSIQQELDNVLIKDPDKDKKIQLVGKDEIKRKIGRSPDISDSLMMRMYYVITGLGVKQEKMRQTQPQSFENYLDL